MTNKCSILLVKCRKKVGQQRMRFKKREREKNEKLSKKQFKLIDNTEESVMN